jgi:hypothetical protein
MPGFLDPDAVSLDAEYVRYLSPDILGKIILKNFAMNVLGLGADRIRVPISRHGDVGAYRDLSDSEIRVGSRRYSIETKCSYHVVAKRSRCAADPSPRWNFSGLLHSARSRHERTDFELVFAVGVNMPGLEDSQNYWRQLKALRKRQSQNGERFDFGVRPHEKAFLDLCGIYILPRLAIPVNQLDVTIRVIDRRPDYSFFAWGYDEDRLRAVWHRALQIINSPVMNNEADSSFTAARR